MGVLDDLAEAAGSVAEITSSVAAAGEKVLEVANQLETARSLAVEVDNHLDLITLSHLQDRDNFSSGGFGPPLPEDEIAPHKADIFGVQSKGGGVGTGVVGSVTYSAPGLFTMLVGFNNPAFGSNKANVSLQGPNDTITRFRVRCLIGAGNKTAARYQLNRHGPYSIGTWLRDHNVALRDPNNPNALINDGLKVALPRAGFDLPPKGVPLRFRDLLVIDGGQSAAASS